jgi:hypothetical protein
MSIPSIIDFFPGIAGLTGSSYKILNPALEIIVSNYSALESGKPLRYDVSHDKFLEIIKTFDAASCFSTPDVLSPEVWSDYRNSEVLKIVDIINNNKGDS